MSVCGMGEGVFLKRWGGGSYVQYPVLVFQKNCYLLFEVSFFFLQVFCVNTSEGMSMHCQNNYAMFVLSLMT